MILLQGKRWQAHKFFFISVVVGYAHLFVVRNFYKRYQRLTRSCKRICVLDEKTSNGKSNEYFAAMEDYRKQGYVKHKMINIIAISIAAVICGAEDWYDIEDYGKEKYEWLKTFLDLSDGVPSHDTYNRFFSFANPEALGVLKIG